MRKVYGEQRGASDSADATKRVQHNKFFELEDDGQQVIARWGNIGAKTPRSEILVTSPDPAVRKLAWDKKYRDKFERKSNPYIIIEANGAKVENRPDAQGRGWGLEVETHSRLDPVEIAEKMRERGLKVNVAVARYFHSDGNVWDVKRDGSCGYEFASPILRGDAGIFDAKVAVEKIREVCPTAVNANCGIHVTIGIQDHSPAELKRLIVGYLKSQENFYALCNETRQENRYCKRNPTNNLVQILQTAAIEKVADLAGGWRQHDDRYHGLNLTRMFSKRVVEFRMLESTVSIRKVGDWIMTCVGFVDGLKASGVTFKTPDPIGPETFNQICKGNWKS